MNGWRRFWSNSIWKSCAVVSSRHDPQPARGVFRRGDLSYAGSVKPTDSIQERASWARTILSFSSRMAPMSREVSERLLGPETRFENDRFKIRLASNLHSHRSATLLVNRLYSARGYVSDAAGHAESPGPELITLLVYDAEDQPIGTVTLGSDGSDGLLADGLFKHELDELRQIPGARLLELTRFAMDRHRGNSKQVVATLINMAYLYTQWLGCNWMVIEVNPRHIGFYEDCMGFRRLGDEKTCPRVNAPTVLMVLDMAQSDAQIRRLAGRKGRDVLGKSLYRYFLSEEDAAQLACTLFGEAAPEKS